MTPIIYLKYAELTLKGKNRSDFSNCLYGNIKRALHHVSCDVIKGFDHIIIEKYQDVNQKNIIEILNKIPGISWIIPAYTTQNRDLKDVGKEIYRIIRTLNWTSFKVETKRHDKNYPLNSMEFSKQLGALILQTTQNKHVVMNHPDLLINIEIRNDVVIFYMEKIPGVGGLPVGSSGRCLMLISGGIDSPVAANLLLKRGMHVDFLTFITPPHTKDELVNKIQKLINQITSNQLIDQSSLYICNFTYIQHELAHISDHSYQITLMRRYFYRIAEQCCIKYHYDAFATGESLGQVASQTIESLSVIGSVLQPQTVVLRPLLTYDKLETIKISKNIGTYDISILPIADCCSLFVPTNPVTRPKLSIALKLEKELTLIDELLKQTIDKYIKIID